MLIEVNFSVIAYIQAEVHPFDACVATDNGMPQHNIFQGRKVPNYTIGDYRMAEGYIGANGHIRSDDTIGYLAIFAYGNRVNYNSTIIFR
jgi:hypothetical protein